MKIEIELGFNAILDESDVMPEIVEWLENLRFRHLVSKKIIKVGELNL